MFSAYFLAMTGGLAITSFRLASSQRRFDRGQQKWIDADTNWYTVSAFRGLASNAAVSIVKGDRVVVTGRLRIRDWENTDRSGTTVEIEADTIGHDMFWGTSQFTRVSAAPATEQDPADSQDAWPNAS
jgi:single-strand DNA-binding protein